MSDVQVVNSSSLQSRLSRNDFARHSINRGFSGYNTDGALMTVRHLLATGDDIGRARLVTIFFGANDACRPDRTVAMSHEAAALRSRDFPPVHINVQSHGAGPSAGTMIGQPRLWTDAEIQAEHLQCTVGDSNGCAAGSSGVAFASQHVPLERYEQNLRAMVQLIRGASLYSS